MLFGTISGMESTFSRIHRGIRAFTGVYANLEVHSVGVCITHCLANVPCHAVNFNMATKNCELIASDGPLEIEEGPDCWLVPLNTEGIQHLTDVQ